MDDTPKQSWWERLSGGLKRTSSQLGSAITGLVSKRRLDASTLEELENELIRADFGIDVADRTIAALRRDRFEKNISPEELQTLLAAEIEKTMAPVATPLEVSSRPFVILVTGVNGSGKTAPIGKLAARIRAEGKSVLLVAGDTLRAAAIAQVG